MHKLFVHNPFFRLLSPIFSGVVVYLLILFVNNNVEQLYEQFLGEELYICIGLSYIIQEVSRFQLVLAKYVLSKFRMIVQIGIQIFVAIMLCIAIVTFSMQWYFDTVLGFPAPSEELWLFNSIFCVLTIFYIVLYISHTYLHKINSEKLVQEKLYKENIENDFKLFKQGINSDLLFESLESLIILSKNDKNLSDDFIDNLATVYRYILSSKKRQLVTVADEIDVCKNLIFILNSKSYRNIALENKLYSSFLVVPTSTLFVIEQIVKSSIKSSEVKLKITLSEEENQFIISFNSFYKINSTLNNSKFQRVNEIYSIYSNDIINVNTENGVTTIQIPKLKLKEAS